MECTPEENNQQPITLTALWVRSSLPTHLNHQLKHILTPPLLIRQADQLLLHYTHQNVPIPFTLHVLLTEPVLRGIFSPTQTELTIIHQPNLNPPTPTLTDDDDHGSIEIDTDFLANSILNQSLIHPSTLDHSTHSQLDGHPFHALPLLHPPDSIESNPFDHDSLVQDLDIQYTCCLVRTIDLIKIGVQSGDWVLITHHDPQHHCLSSSNDTSHVQKQYRLIRLVASDHHPSIQEFYQNYPGFDDSIDSTHTSPPGVIFVPPILLFNLTGTISYSEGLEWMKTGQPKLEIIPSGITTLTTTKYNKTLPTTTTTTEYGLPIIKSLTLARIASPQSLTKSLQPHFLRALKHYFELQNRILFINDLIAIPILQSSARFFASSAVTDSASARTPSSLHDPADQFEPDQTLPSSIATTQPDLIIYFKVTQLELLHPENNNVNNSDPGPNGNWLLHNNNNSKVQELMEDGLLGGIVDPKVTKLVQTGLEFGFVPDAQKWLGIDGLSPFIYSPQNKGPCHQVEHIMYEYMKSAGRIDTRRYELNLTMKINGPRGSGKTSMVKRIAESTGYNYLELNCFDLLGETEIKTAGSLKARFERGLQSVPCVLLLRHLEGLARKSQTLETGQPPAIIGTLKDCLHEASIHNHTNLNFPFIIVGTTCDLDTIPLSMLSLFKTHLAIEAPSESERLSILEQLFRKDSVGPDVNLKTIARETAGLVANDLVHLASRARMTAIEQILTMNPHVKIVDLIEAGVQLMAKDIDKAIHKARQQYSESIGAPKIPKVSWEDIGGLSSVIDEILETVELPMKHAELFTKGLKRRSGLLLYGPPGTGKTLLAKGVASSCGLNFFSVKGPELLNMYIGESEANVRRVFQKARDSKPCVIFFDELDSVAPKRGNQGDSGGVMDRIVSQLLAELDGISSTTTSGTGTGNEDAGGGSLDSNAQVIVIGATNRPDLLDPALLRPGRFDKLIYLGIPQTRSNKLDIIKSLTRKFKLNFSNYQDEVGDEKVKGMGMGLDHIVDLIELQELKLANKFTGADLYSVCSEALLASLSRRISRMEEKKKQKQCNIHQYQQQDEPPPDCLHEEEGVTMEDFIKGVASVRPSISLNELNHYNLLQNKFKLVDNSHSSNPDLPLSKLNNHQFTSSSSQVEPDHHPPSKYFVNDPLHSSSDDDSSGWPQKVDIKGKSKLV